MPVIVRAEKRVQFCVYTIWQRDSPGIDLEDTGAVVAGNPDKTDVSRALIVFVDLVIY